MCRASVLQLLSQDLLKISCFLVQLFWCRNAPNLPDELVTLQCFCGPDRARQTILKVSKQTGEVAGRLMGKRRRRRRNSDFDRVNLAKGSERPPNTSDNLRGFWGEILSGWASQNSYSYTWRWAERHWKPRRYIIMPALLPGSVLVTLAREWRFEKDGAVNKIS